MHWKRRSGGAEGSQERGLLLRLHYGEDLVGGQVFHDLRCLSVPVDFDAIDGPCLAQAEVKTRA